MCILERSLGQMYCLKDKLMEKELKVGYFCTDLHT